MIEQVLERNLIDLKARIIENHVRAGQVASGRTRDSLTVTIESSGGAYIGTLWGRSFFGALETGNKPWQRKPKRVPHWFHDIIEQWIDDKGLDLNAWAVSYNIIHSGTRLYQSGGRDDIFSNEIPKTLDSIGEELLLFYDQQITEMITLNNKTQ